MSESNAEGVRQAGLLQVYRRKRRNWRLVLPPGIPLKPVPGGAVQGYFNSTLLAGDPQRLALICRKSYYTLSPKGHMIEAIDPARTRNYCLEFAWANGRLRLQQTRSLPALDGLEDLRVFHGVPHKFFFAVELLSPQLVAMHPAGLRSAPVVGVITSRDAQVEIRRMQIPETPRRVEKNWVYYQDGNRLLIEKSPGSPDLYVVDPTALTLTREAGETGPLFWSGTKSVAWNGGILFLDHRRIKLPEPFRIKVRYVYRFRYHAGGTVRHSREFSMGPRASVSYVSDLQAASALAPDLGDGVVLSVSTNDNSFALFLVESQELRRLLRTPPAPP